MKSKMAKYSEFVPGTISEMHGFTKCNNRIINYLLLIYVLILVPSSFIMSISLDSGNMPYIFHILYKNFTFFQVRYDDLQTFDGFSGKLYFSSVLILLIFIFPYIILFNFVYFSIFFRIKTFKKMTHKAIPLVIFTLCLIFVSVYTSIFQNINISEKIYKGFSLIFVSPILPFYLLGLLLLVPISIQIVGTFIAKLIRQKGRLF